MSDLPRALRALVPRVSYLKCSFASHASCISCLPYSHVKTNNDSEVSLRGLERENSNTYMKEYLTSMNKMFLWEASNENKRLNFEFPEYTFNGQFRVKKSKSSEHIKQDLVDIT